jgi:hypothetical protein
MISFCFPSGRRLGVDPHVKLSAVCYTRCNSHYPFWIHFKPPFAFPPSPEEVFAEQAAYTSERARRWQAEFYPNFIRLNRSFRCCLKDFDLRIGQHL